MTKGVPAVRLGEWRGLTGGAGGAMCRSPRIRVDHAVLRLIAVSRAYSCVETGLAGTLRVQLSH